MRYASRVDAAMSYDRRLAARPRGGNASQARRAFRPRTNVGGGARLLHRPGSLISSASPSMWSLSTQVPSTYRRVVLAADIKYQEPGAPRPRNGPSLQIDPANHDDHDRKAARFTQANRMTTVSCRRRRHDGNGTQRILPPLYTTAHPLGRSSVPWGGHLRREIPPPRPSSRTPCS